MIKFESFYFNEFDKLYDYIGYTIDDFLQKYDMYEVSDLQLGTDYAPKTVYVNENDEIPFLIVQYNEVDTFGVIGCRVDTFMTQTELLQHNIVSALNFNEFYNVLQSYHENTRIYAIYNDYDEYKITTFTPLDCGMVTCEIEVLPVNLVTFKMMCKSDILAYFQVNFDDIEKTTDMLQHILVNTEW